MPGKLKFNIMRLNHIPLETEEPQYLEPYIGKLIPATLSILPQYLQHFHWAESNVMYDFFNHLFKEDQMYTQKKTNTEQLND